MEGLCTAGSVLGSGPGVGGGGAGAGGAGEGSRAGGFERVTGSQLSPVKSPVLPQ